MTYRTCAVAGCDKDASGHKGGGRGWCNTHYQRWRRHGDPEHGGPVQRQTGTGQPCSMDGCRLPVVAADLCERHYRRFKRYGDAGAGRLSPLSLTDEARFWSKVSKTETCWLWTDAPNGSGYGTFKPTGQQSPTMAHRYSYELAGQTLTPGMTLDHLCRVLLCVRPSHLEEVTYAENLRRAREAAGDSVVGDSS